jgi:hypothetical protein
MTRRGGLRTAIRSLVQQHIRSRTVPAVGFDPNAPAPLPPHRIALYADFVRKAQSAGIVLGPLPVADRNRVTLSLRHDIDAEPGHVQLFRDIERELGVRSSFYFIIDGVVPGFPYTYPVDTLGALGRELRDDGFVVGLHSIAWAQPNATVALKAERERFRAVFGFPPDSETFHGFLDQATTAKLRRRFNVAYLLRHGMYFEDYRRVVLSDSEAMPLRLGLRLDELRRGVPYEFMTHPQYWIA